MSPDRDTEKTSRSKLACQICRANKVRCLRDSPAAPICNRCKRFGLPCTLPPVLKRRGRPPKGQRDEVSHPHSGSQARTHPPALSHRHSSSYPMQTFAPFPDSMLSSLPQTAPAPSLRPAPISVPFYESMVSQPSNHAGPSEQRPQPLSNPGMSFSSQTSLPLDVPTVYSDPSTHLSATSDPEERRRTHRKGSSNVDVSDYLDPGERVFKASEPKGPFFHNRSAVENADEESEEAPKEGNEGIDPITLRILTEVEAHALVQLFIERLNPFIAVFDAKLHNLTYLRSTSSILFTATLASSAKFFRKDLYPLLLSHAQTILDRGVAQGRHDIGIIQSLMILTYWKVPEDTSAWIKIGLAIRMGYQGHWHLPRTKPLPSDEMQAREILNAERTWFCLFCFDRGLSQTFGLPTAIAPSHMGDVESWARAHTHLAPQVDMHLALSSSLCKLKDHWRALFQSNSPSPQYVESAIDLLISQCESLLARWFNSENPPPDFNPARETGPRWSVLDFILILHRHRLELAPGDPLRIDACLGIASQIVEMIESLADSGGLAILQDTASCMSSSLSVLLHKVFRSCTPSQKSLVISLLQRILLSNTRVSNGDDLSATAYVSRFTRRILSAMGNESRAASPKAEAGQGAGTREDDQPDFMAQLEKYLRVPDDVTQTEVDDEQYWAQLFSAAPGGGTNGGFAWGAQDNGQETLGYSNPFL